MLKAIYLIIFIIMFPSVYATELTQLFQSTNYHYSISYPADWSYHQVDPGAVIFKPNLPNHQSINIQTLYTKQGGGKYKDVKALMDDFYDQVPRHTNQVLFLERKPISLTSYQGEQTTFLFSENGLHYKQWQIMLLTEKGNIFQAWAYRNLQNNFDKDYEIAKEMLNSWKIS